MAKRRPSPPLEQKAPSAAMAREAPEATGFDSVPAPSATLTQDEKQSPLFRSLRDIDAIEDPEERLQAALDRLDAISKLALGRERVSKGGEPILDPDCHAAVKVEEVAHRLLSIEARRVKPRVPDLSAFSKPPALSLAKG